MAPLSMPSLSEVRAQFPGLRDDFAFFENAGGSHLPLQAIAATKRYMETSFVQLGAGYPLSADATAQFAKGREFGSALFGANGTGRTIFGPSSSMLIRHLADAYSYVLKPGDQVIVANTGHEANVGPWVRLERFGVEILWWHVNPDSFLLETTDLLRLLTERTKIVALPQVSNLLGAIEDVPAITALSHAAGARVVLDSVALAPHRALDVQAWKVDWAVFSAYKVYAPHLGLMWGSDDAFEELTGPNHFFIDRKQPSKFELGCQPHELVAGLLGTGEYLQSLARSSDPCSRDTVVRAFSLIEELEMPTQARFLAYLRDKSSVRIIGPASAGSERVGTISFVSDRLDSASIARHADRRGIGIRYGHVYAYRLCEALGISPDPGVVRVSFAHYNTVEEVDRLIAVLEEIL